MKYHLFNPLTGQYQRDLIEADALILRDADIDDRLEKLSTYTATQKEYKRKNMEDFLAAEAVWPEAKYYYTTHNMDTNTDLANVFRGHLGLLKVVNGVVTETYFANHEVGGIQRAYVTYRDSLPYEYYEESNGCMQKINCATNVVVTETNFGPLPPDKIFDKGEVLRWSQKEYGFIVEYVPSIKIKSKDYNDDYAESKSKNRTSILSEHPIVQVTIDADGNEVWSAYLG